MKKRYYWQPELSVGIIYWSATFIVLFYGLILTLEKTHLYWKGNIFIGVSLLFFLAGFHRFFCLEKEGIRIKYALFWRKKRVLFTDIKQLTVRQNGVLIFRKDSKKVGRYVMNQKQKERFLVALKERFPNIPLKEENIRITHE